MQASPQRVDNTGIFGAGEWDSAAAGHTVRGIHGVKSRAAQQKLQLQQQQQQQQQQLGSGPLSANRMRTLTMSTPHLTQHPKHAHFNFVNHLAVRDQATVQRVPSQAPMAIVPVAVFTALPGAVNFGGCLSASSLISVDLNSWQSQQQQQQQQQQPLQSRETWWGSSGSNKEGRQQQRPRRSHRLASVQLIRSCGRSESSNSGANDSRTDSEAFRHRLNTTDCATGAVSPPLL